MKRSELIFNIVSIPVDIVSLFLSGLMSFYIRLWLNPYIPVLFTPDRVDFTKNLFAVIFVLLVIFAFSGLYNLRGTRKFMTNEFYKIVGAISLALLFIVFVFFFNQSFFNSRLIILIAWAVCIIFVSIARFILKKIQGVYLNRGQGLHNIAVITGKGDRNHFVEQLKANKQYGFNVVAEITEADNVLEKLEQLYSEKKIEEILQADPEASQQFNLQLLQFARGKGLEFNYVPNLFNVQQKHIETDTIEGIPVISIKNTPLSGWGSVVKRIFDIFAAILCLILTSPLFIIIAVLIKLDSRGKILYSAPRAGLNKDFVFYKFRTMQQHLSVGSEFGGAEAELMRQELWQQNVRGGKDGAFLKIKDDPRVTKLGRILRKTKLDEIPQFINVLKGDMSMVGPRAHVIDEVARYRDKHQRIFTIKPGIFGLSQIAQLSWPDLPLEEEINLNTYYIENWSVGLDLVILTKSAYYLIFSPKAKDNY